MSGVNLAFDGLTLSAVDQDSGITLQSKSGRVS